MKIAGIPDTKPSLRRYFTKTRATISDRNRSLSSLIALTKAHQNVLSYSSFNTEVETDALNTLLLKENKLILPKITGNILKLFHVEHLSQLQMNTWKILEPNPKICTEIFDYQISMIIVPGLAFDKRGHRLGYGKGFYDRLLEKLSKNTETIGLGFKEQWIDELPIEAHDIPLKHVFLV